ncbi:Phospholipid scramblase 1 [Anabarilius grahami]|uniref:Phospholipid scramblase n=1 Tax=Anabarilius grahami TaxID=495550 RepID=A0A3N0YZU9_ANAGA|nr:Phospholipid scramblase 1 [Anabarilius grahami]
MPSRSQTRRSEQNAKYESCRINGQKGTARRAARGPFPNALSRQSAARREVRHKHTAARIHQPEERSPPDAMTSNTNVIVIRSLSPAPGKLRENKTFSNFPTSSSTSPMIAATVKPQHKQGPEPPGRDADSSSLGKSAKREQSKQQTNTQQCPQALCMCAPLQTEKRSEKYLEIQSPPGNPIGYVIQNWHPFIPKFTIQNEKREAVLKIVGPFCSCRCCADVNFDV